MRTCYIPRACVILFRREILDMYNHSFFFISEMCTLSISGFSQTSFDIFSIVTLIKPVRYMIPASFTQYDAILFVLKQTSNKEYSNQPDDFCATIRCQFHRTLFSPCPTCQKFDHKWFLMLYNSFSQNLTKKVYNLLEFYNSFYCILQFHRLLFLPCP